MVMVRERLSPDGSRDAFVVWLDGRECAMREPSAASGAGAGGNEGLISAGRGVFDRFGLANAGEFAEIVSRYRDHPLWAVWLPTDGRGCVTVRPAGSRPPGPEVPMVWMAAQTAVQLGTRMRVADAGSPPPGDGY
jgi:hypothetical protein